MTPNQEKLYWREWAAVRRKEPIVDRHELHRRALGKDLSHKAFSNEDFDKVLGVFRALSRPADLDAQIAQFDQPRKRLLYKIQVLQFAQLRALMSGQDEEACGVAAESYFQRILTQRFAGQMLENMSYSDLENVRCTLAARIHSLRARPKIMYQTSANSVL